MGWDAAFVGELQIDSKKFKELRQGSLPEAPVAGLDALTTESPEARSFDAVLEALEAYARKEPERLLQVEAKPRKGTVTFVGVLDEDSFRELLPGISQIFARGASLGGTGALTMFGRESDDDLARKKRKGGGFEVTFKEWSAERTLARGLLLGALQRLHERHPVRRVVFALPG